MKKIITLLICLICCCSYAQIWEGNGGDWLSEDVAVGKAIPPFDPTSHQIYFVDSDGVTPVQYTQYVADGDDFNTSGIKPNKKTGYSFSGWYDVLDNPVVILTNVTADVTLKASWTINQWILTLHDNSSSPRTYTYNWNATVTQYTPTPKTGHNVATWSPSLPSRMPDNNFETTAVYTPNAHTITTKNGSTVLATYQTYYGQPISELNIPIPTAPEGKIFVRWSPALPETMGDSNLTVSAVFEPYTITVTYNHPDGTLYQTRTYAAGSDIVEPEEPTYTDDYFWDWSDLPSVAVATMTTTAQVFAKTNTVYGLEINLDATATSTAFTYLYDAEGMLPVRVQTDDSYANWERGQATSWRDFIEQFVRPCMLKADGTVDYYLDPDNQAYKYSENGTQELSDITDSTYNGWAMVEFKKMWSNVKRIRGTNKYRLIITPQEITDITYAEAFKRNDGTYADRAYMSMFPPVYVNNVPKSYATNSAFDSLTSSVSTLKSRIKNIGNGWETNYEALTQHFRKLIYLIGKTYEPVDVFFHPWNPQVTINSSGTIHPINNSLSGYQNGAFYCQGHNEDTGLIKILWINVPYGQKAYFQDGYVFHDRKCMIAYPPFGFNYSNYIQISDDYSNDSVYMSSQSSIFYLRYNFYHGIAYPEKFVSSQPQYKALVGKDKCAFIISPAQRRDTASTYYMPSYRGFPANYDFNTKPTKSADGVSSTYWHCGYSNGTVLPQTRGFTCSLAYIEPPASYRSAPRLMMSAPRQQEPEEPIEEIATPTEAIATESEVIDL